MSELECAETLRASIDQRFGAVERVPLQAVEWVSFLVRIREVPSSNLSPETGRID